MATHSGPMHEPGSEAPSSTGATAVALRPVAHWVRMREGDRNRLVMIWEVPDPVPAAARTVSVARV